MNNKSMITGAAIAGLLSGSFVAQARAASSSNNNGPTASNAGISIQMLAHADKGRNSCKGANSCKGQGGCKTGDNGCKGKNSCKGKGGCAS